MSTPSQRQTQLSSAGALVAPLLAVALIRFAGPQQSVAAAPPMVIDSAGLPSMPTFESDLPGPVSTAAGYAARLFESGFSGSPFPEAARRDSVSDTPPDPSMPEIDIADDPYELPDIRITAIMARREGAIAVIDARIRAVGARVAPGWTLDAVDEQNRTIVVRNDSGRRVEMTLSTP